MKLSWELYPPPMEKRPVGFSTTSMFTMILSLVAPAAVVALTVSK